MLNVCVHHLAPKCASFTPGGILQIAHFFCLWLCVHFVTTVVIFEFWCFCNLNFRFVVFVVCRPGKVEWCAICVYMWDVDCCLYFCFVILLLLSFFFLFVCVLFFVLLVFVLCVHGASETFFLNLCTRTWVLCDCARGLGIVLNSVYVCVFLFLILFLCIVSYIYLFFSCTLCACVERAAINPAY